KMSFDAKTGQLWVGDVGWEMWEMIYRIERAGNYGWSIVEGPQSVKPESPRGPTPILPPAAAHSHIESRSITGGFVYRGRRLPKLSGHYIYGDYVTGKIWSLPHDRPGSTPRDVADSTLQIIAFGEDAQRELLVVGYDGTLHELEPDPSPAANTQFPQRLSQTGVYDDVAKHLLAPGVIAYAINAEPWADGAVARRMLGLPAKSDATQTSGLPQLAVEGDQNPQQGQIRGAWSFPPETVLVKTLSLPSGPKPGQLRRIETQILHRDRDTWRGYSYAWNEAQTDAELVSVGGRDQTVSVFDATAQNQQRQQTWHFPSRNECIICHTTRAGSILGFNAAQLNRPTTHPTTQSNQLESLITAAYLDDPRQGNPQAKLPQFANPYDTTRDLETRARAYLHVNCAHCHRRGGGGTATFVLLHSLSVDKLLLIDQRPTQGTFNIHGAQVVAPGDPFRSVLYYRTATIGRGRMPHIGSAEVDQRGEDLLFDWIQQMPRGKDSAPQNPSATALQNSLLRLRQNKQGVSDIDALLASTDGALRLMRAITQDNIEPATVQQVLSRASANAAPEIQGLFQRFQPHDQRVRRLGGSINPQDILARTGNTAAGKKLFHKTAGVQCKNCHRIGQDGKQVGPDLTTIGKKQNRENILDSILNPSRQIETKYLSYIVETTNGLVLSGLLE
ncbi:MAG: c-type cytochrome, partial [Planctomycetaceae bacterium]